MLQAHKYCAGESEASHAEVELEIIVIIGPKKVLLGLFALASRPIRDIRLFIPNQNFD
jgi:hypothetical protein